MRKAIFLSIFVILILLIATAYADVSIDDSFPDIAFRNYVKKEIDKNNDGLLSETELSSTTIIEMCSPGITNMTGIELFKNLEELDCDSGNNIEFLDVSKNTKLKSLICTYSNLHTLLLNTALEGLSFEGNHITSIDLSQCNNLRTLRCGSNELTKLDISHCQKLENLDCELNYITTIDLSHNPYLKYFKCQSGKFTSLDFSANTLIEEIDCRYNYLSSLNVTNLANLSSLDCRRNNITSLDLRGCTQMTYLISKGIKHIDDWERSISYTLGDLAFKVDKIATIYTDNGKIPSSAKPIKVKGINLNESFIVLTRTARNSNPTFKLKASFDPSNATNKMIEWTSSNKKIASVDQDGLVTAIKKGTVTITCKSKSNPKAKASCTILITDQQIKSIKLNKKNATLKKGDTLQLTIKKVKPADALNLKYKWSSSNKKVAKVNKNGLVTAVGKGECIITCSTKDGSNININVKIKVK